MNKLLLRRRVVLRVIVFADPLVKSICVENWGGATGGSTNVAGVAGEMTYEQAAAVTELGEVFRGTNIVSFNELQYFTGLTGISNNAFRECRRLVSFILPTQITSIGDNVTYQCNSLLNFEIPQSVTHIGQYFLSVRCDAFTGTLTIPASVSSWRGNCIGGVNVNKIIFNTTTLPGDSFISSANLHSIGRLGSGADVEFPNAVTTLAINMFRGNKGFVNIIVPEGITNLLRTCFYGCPNLESVVLPSTISTLGSSAFEECPKLTSFTILSTNPPSATAIFSSDYVPTIYVPAGSVETYKTNQYWSAYADNIQAIPSN